MKNLGIYVHIPFCLKKCLYCDFCSFDNQKSKILPYFSALNNEIKINSSCFADYLVDSVFIGGGTPTSVNSELLEETVRTIRSCFTLSDRAEITVECNPKTADQEYFYKLKKAGVNRISIGAQSFIDSELLSLGRIHSANDVKNTVEQAKNAKINNINLDLMFGIPNQTMESYSLTLSEALKLKPEHISTYSLIIEEGTPFYNMNLSLPDEDTERNMYDYTINVLEENGYNRYEISNFSKFGKKCIHNLKYWSLYDYIGFGLAAHSFVNNKRFSNTNNLTKYINNDYKTENIIQLTTNDLISDYIMLAFRKAYGVNKKDFYIKFGLNFNEEYKNVIDKHIKNGLLQDNGTNVFLTKNGVSVSNYVMCDFI